jgi:hypothetical protein
MTPLQICINLFAYAVFSLGALLIWPSRKNVAAWLGLPFFVVAFLIPLLVVDYTQETNPEVIRDLTRMNLAGAMAMVVGMIFGTQITLPSLPLRFRQDYGRDDLPGVLRRTMRVLMVGCAIMSLCFAWMGFLPMFAEVPFLAKFFKGPYKEKYDQVSIFYRLSQVLVTTSLPVAMAMSVSLRNRKLWLLILWAVGLFAVSLNRGTVAAGALLMFGVWASRSRLAMAVFLTSATAIVCLGSSIYALLGIIAVPEDFDLWSEIARGAPDIQDHLTFLGAFDPDRQLTYGLTFVGGLVPCNFAFNPSVYTLAVVNETSDISEIASGGFRLPPSVAGYMAFSWVGAVLVPLGTGLLTGCLTTRLRRLPSADFFQQSVAVLWFQVVAGFWIEFYSLAYHGLIAVVVFAYLVPNASALSVIAPNRGRSAP